MFCTHFKCVIVLLLFLIISSVTNLYAKTCFQVIEATDLLTFNLKSITVDKSCTKLELTLNHIGKGAKVALGHNWVLSETMHVTSITTGGLRLGIKNDYLDYSDKRIIAATKLIGGGETDTITIDLTKMIKVGGDYTFFCTFPGHLTMRGKFIYK